MFLTCFSSVVVSNRQKQSVSDAFQNVVLPPDSRSSLLREVAQRELAMAKLHKIVKPYALNRQKTQKRGRFRIFLAFSYGQGIAQMALCGAECEISARHIDTAEETNYRNDHNGCAVGREAMMVRGKAQLDACLEDDHIAIPVLLVSRRLDVYSISIFFPFCIYRPCADGRSA